MGFFKTQKGRIIGNADDPPKKDEKEDPSNGQNQDLECPHNMPVNTCSICLEKSKKDDPTDD